MMTPEAHLSRPEAIGECLNPVPKPDPRKVEMTRIIMARITDADGVIRRTATQDDFDEAHRAVYGA